MKNLFISLFLLPLLSFSGCDEEDSSQLTLLTDALKSDLQFLREEEKLARDVYLFSYDKYGHNVFNNISSSEQTHMDRALDLLNKYNVPDPVGNNGRGVFQDTVLQRLYNELTAQADISLLEAFNAGATIEDLDINDIDGFIVRADGYPDIITVYEALACGSRNHLRSYVSQINQQGSTYASQFITVDEYNSIINGAHEQCGYGKR